MKLASFLSGGDQHIAAWRSPSRTPRAGADIEVYAESLAILEKACFDLVLAGDVFPDAIESSDIRSQMPTYDRLEPITMLAALARSSRRIGLVATASTTFNAPFHVARKFASLDRISNGRAGWNLVTTSTPSDALNFGLKQHPPHQERYERAEEFVNVVLGLWHSWNDDAFIRDRASGRYFRPEGMHVLNHHGKHFDVLGPIDIPRSPQGHPLIVQAGSSGPGQALAARVADVVFTSQNIVTSAKAFYAGLKAKVAEFGRAPEHCHILVGLLPCVASTEKAAKEKFEEVQSLIPSAVALSKLAHILGDIDLSLYPLDAPLPRDLPPGNGIMSRRDSIQSLGERRGFTLRQLAAYIGGTRGHWNLVGTPEFIADQMQEWVEAGAADGFLIYPTVLPEGVKDFAEMVVPELQRRGVFRTEYEGETVRENLGLPIERFGLEETLQQLAASGAH